MRPPLPGGGREENTPLNHPKKHHAFTLVELLVVLATTGVLLAIASASWSEIVGRARATQCLAHLRVIGTATMSYASDNDMTLPATSHQRRSGLQSWTLSLQPYAGGKLSFRCPADEDPTRPYSYVLNDFLTPNPSGARDLDFSRLNRLNRPGSTILFAEAVRDLNSDHFHFATYRGQATPADVFAGEVAVERHRGGANYLFADGHVENLSWIQVRERLAEPRSRFVDPTGQDPAPPRSF